MEIIKELPDNFSADELIERVVLLEKIETGLDQVANGKVVTDEELDERLAKWLR